MFKRLIWLGEKIPLVGIIVYVFLWLINWFGFRYCNRCRKIHHQLSHDTRASVFEEWFLIKSSCKEDDDGKTND